MATSKEVAVAKEVFTGKWGNGDDRKKKLTQAGYNPATIQSLVNRLAKGENIDRLVTTTTQTASKDYATIGKKVEKCLSDIRNLSSFKELENML